MFIDKVKNLGSAFEPKKSAPVKKSSELLSNDNVHISDAAKLKADIKAEHLQPNSYEFNYARNFSEQYQYSKCRHIGK